MEDFQHLEDDFVMLKVFTIMTFSLGGNTKLYDKQWIGFLY